MTAAHEVWLRATNEEGRLTEQDVEDALNALPRGCEMVVRLDECADFEMAAASRLARELAGCSVRHVFGPGARRVSADWLASYERCALEYLTVEASLLRLRP